MTAIQARIAYAARTDHRPRYYANYHARDTVLIEGHVTAIADGREVQTLLDDAGFSLVQHVSAVTDFADAAAVATVHADEIIALLQAQTGADLVRVTSPGILRFSERSGKAGSTDNSMPARFAHIDVTAETGARLSALGVPKNKSVRRCAQYNIWRAFSGAPQDVPLALCDARSVAPDDLIIADAIFDTPGKPEWGFESWLVAHNAAHRWHWFPDMTRDEAIIFKTSDSEFSNAVPHVAFDNLNVPDNCPARASIEMRATAYWYG
jgi:hypothetical protein